MNGIFPWPFNLVMWQFTFIVIWVIVCLNNVCSSVWKSVTGSRSNRGRHWFIVNIPTAERIGLHSAEGIFHRTDMDVIHCILMWNTLSFRLICCSTISVAISSSGNDLALNAHCASPIRPEVILKKVVFSVIFLRIGRFWVTNILSWTQRILVVNTKKI